MSLINATLVAQAIHFSIAFILIKYFLFKPVFAQIAQEDKLQESLITTVQLHQQEVSHKEQELQAQWHVLRDYFAAHVPFIKTGFFSARKNVQVQLPEVDQKKIDTAINVATQQIIKKVDNVW